MNGPLIKVLTFCGSKISLAGSPRTFSLLSVERATESDEKLTPLVEPWQSCRNFRRLSSSSLKKKGGKKKKKSPGMRTGQRNPEKGGQKATEGETQSVPVRQAEKRSFGSLVVRRVDRNLESVRFFPESDFIHTFHSYKRSRNYESMLREENNNV